MRCTAWRMGVRYRPSPNRRPVMRLPVAFAVALMLAGCGAETAGTAATAASLKKQEMEQGQKTMERAQQKIDGAMQQLQERAGSADK